jgi:protein-S-isoprenylcysteine O-methyltransferase Ste14
LSSERRLATDSKQLARIPAFVGILVLLYTVGSGLALSQSPEQIEAATLRHHSVAGIVGTILCFVGIAIVIRQSRTPD